MPNDAIAAIDLGSNSFHMLVARPLNGHLQVVDRLKEMVQLGAGLDAERRLSKAAQSRALECLSRFGQRLQSMPAGRVRIVGTNTLRQARNGRELLARARQVLGHSVEIISGIEEARLIYLGVAHSTAPVDGKRLVIDIGGGSTELIIGQGFEPLHLESLHMGCVSTTRRYFAKGKIKDSALRAAELMVRVQMEPVEAAYRELGWSLVTGASGSIKAIGDVLQREGLGGDGISRESMQQLRSLILELKDTDAMAKRWDLNPQRAWVFTGGFAVLHGVFQALDIDRATVSEGALREGVIYDLVGRMRHEDVRVRTIESLVRRAGLDVGQSQRVAATAVELLSQVGQAWGLSGEEPVLWLEWAARLHELGLAIAHSNHHKHGAYILQHSDLPGFSRTEQRLLAALVRGHRRKFPATIFEELPAEVLLPVQRLCVLLRLAVLLHRSRSSQALPRYRLSVRESRLELVFPAGWLEAHPLSRADLEAEAEYLQAAGLQLSVATAPDLS